MKNRKRTLLAILIGFSFILMNAQGSIPEWTHFRGPNLDGISHETGLPESWNDSSHIAWKTPIDGKGWSSPVVLGDQIWLTTATAGGLEMRGLCVDFTSGKIIHNKLLFTPDSLYRKHSINSYATPTSAIEDGFVYVHFGRYGTACLDTRTGETIWKRTDMQCEHIQGPGSSLFIYRNKLIVHMEGSDKQHILALDKHSGKTLWQTERPKELYDHLEYIGKKAYTTPIIVRVNGRDLMISNGSAACIAYDPETGEEIWRIIQGEDSTIAMPVESEGILYFYTGYVTTPDGRKHSDLLAVDPDGLGDITSSNIQWRLQSPALQLLTPIIADGLLYTVDSKSLLSCLDARNGHTVWSKKLKGKYYSSPVYADGHIYLSSIKGETLVFKAGPELELVSENRLEGEIWATPAVTGGAILMRTSEFLYKISY
ncbi:MAG: PQQ-binding-like beta-propeller repeat protein [Bacteroidota bacterium]